MLLAEVWPKIKVRLVTRTGYTRFQIYDIQNLSTKVDLSAAVGVMETITETGRDLNIAASTLQ